MTHRILVPTSIDGTLTISQIQNATTDTDKFLVSDGGEIKFRTGAELVSDLGLGGGFVPYIGATTDVNLGTYGLTSDYLRLNLTPDAVPTGEAVISWNQTERCLDIQEGGTSLQSGQEQRFPLVKAAVAIRNGMAAYASDQVGGSENVIVSPFESSASGPEELYLLGVATQPFAINQIGFVTTFGKVREVDGSSYTATSTGIKDPNDTNTWAFGTVLYCSPNATYPGCLTSVKPISPNKIMPIAMVIKAPVQTNITIMVRAEHGFHLGELHDVRESVPVNRDILSYDSVDAVWKYQSPTTLGIVSGTGLNGRLAFWTGTDTQSSDTNLFWNNSTKALGVGTNQTSHRLTVAGNILAKDQIQILLDTSNSLIAQIRVYNNSFSVKPLALLPDGGANLVVGALTDNGFDKLQVNGSAYFASSITASSIIKSGGTSSQFLKADGSVDSTSYTPSTGGSGYIQNQNSYAQPANMWISGTGQFGNSIGLWKSGGSQIISVNNDNSAYESLSLFAGAYNFNVGSATFSSTVSASNGTLIGGTLTSGYIPKATGTNSLGDSNLSDNGTSVNSLKTVLIANLSGTLPSYNATYGLRINGRDGDINGIRVGKGNNSNATNTALGYQTLNSISSAIESTAVGYNVLRLTTSGGYNTGIGSQSLELTTTGVLNVGVGSLALQNNTTGTDNVGIGHGVLRLNTTGSYNIALGTNAGRYIANKITANINGFNSVFLGYRTSPLADNQTNQVVIGYDAIGLGSNSTVIGNSSTVQTKLEGQLLLGGAVYDGNSALRVNTYTVLKSGSTDNFTATPTREVASYQGAISGVVTSTKDNVIYGNTVVKSLDVRSSNGVSNAFPLQISGTGNIGNGRGIGIQFNRCYSSTNYLSSPYGRIGFSPNYLDGNKNVFFMQSYDTTTETWSDNGFYVGHSDGKIYSNGLKSSTSVQVANDTATASASNVGAIRYRSDANNSYMDMVMQTGATTYAWVNVVQNTW